MNTYRVVTEKTLELLTENVNDMLSNGWRPKGGILATYNQDKSICSYMQALVIETVEAAPVPPMTDSPESSTLTDYLEIDTKKKTNKEPLRFVVSGEDYRKLELVAREQEYALRKTLGYLFDKKTVPYAPIAEVRQAIQAFEELIEETLP